MDSIPSLGVDKISNAKHLIDEKPANKGFKTSAFFPVSGVMNDRSTKWFYVVSGNIHTQELLFLLVKSPSVPTSHPFPTVHPRHIHHFRLRMSTFLFWKTHAGRCKLKHGLFLDQPASLFLSSDLQK